MNVSFEALFNLAKMAYLNILRELLVKAVKETDNPWDDYTVVVIDKIFGLQK